SPDQSPVQTGLFQEIFEAECHYLNGTERVRFVQRSIYNQEQYVHFDSDVGLYEADTPMGESLAKYWNKQADFLAQRRAAVDTFCRHNYNIFKPFIDER
ncbi:2B11 protein, partial [Alcedo cyanopectus]|nr:2B11 protein [Ceyx cyanopectus]